MRIYEYEEIEVGDNNAGRKHLSQAELKVLERINDRLVKDKVVSARLYEYTNSDAIRFQHFTGAIDLGTVILELLPKVFSDNGDAGETPFLSLAKIISYIFDETVRSNEQLLRIWEGAKTNILDLFIFFYRTALSKSLKHGAFKGYEEEYIDERYLRGRILIEKQVAKIDHSKFSQVAFHHSSDTQLMRYLKSVTSFLASVASSHELKEGLHRLESYFDEVESIPLAKLKEEMVIINRMNENFRSPYVISKFILKGMSLAPDERKQARGIAILFDMNRVFEQFVAEFLKRNRQGISPEGSPFEIYTQSSDQKHLFLARTTDYLKPDIRIENHSGAHKTVWIIDTKYKNFNVSENGREPISNVSSNDLYQAFVYAKKYSAKATIIVYPGKKTFCSFSDRFDTDNKFFLWEMNMSLLEEDWESKLTREFRSLFDEIP